MSLAAPLLANANDSFSGTIDKAEGVLGPKAAGHPTSWNELSKTDHHDLHDARIARRHSDLPKSIYAHGLKAGDAKGGGTLAPSIAAPVPEPETWAMMLLGLGVVGLWARRRT
jgi:hypothetical protein